MAFIWRIFSAIGIYTTCPYDADAADQRRSMAAPNKLDPIDVAGDCKLGTVRKMAIELRASYGHNAIDLLSEPEKIFLPQMEPKRIEHHRPTSVRYTKRFETLEESKILHRENGPSGLKYINGYFSVPKDEEVDRSILNAKALSKLFMVPDPVNLQPISEFFSLLVWLVTAMIGRTEQLYYCHVLDLRHWFHQIKVGPKLSCFFGVHLGDIYYRWVTLPMGWSWSPRVCQCIAWTLLLWHQQPTSNLDGLARTRRELRGSLDPPRLAWMRNDDGTKVGFMVLTYDNMCFVCTDPAIAAYLRDKLKDNFQYANVKVKQTSVKYVEPFAMQRTPDMSFDEQNKTGFCHLGVQYTLLQRDGMWIPTWRHDPARLERWNTTVRYINPSSSRRDIARGCGVVIWHWTVLTRPLCYASDLIDIIRSISAKTKREWDESANLEQTALQYLRAQLVIAIKNDWVLGLPQPRVTSSYILFSDASKLLMGAVLCNHEGEVLNVWPRRFPNGFEEAHIYLKELGAIVWYVIALVNLYHLAEIKLTIVTDNSAAYFSLVHWYSSNRVACRWLKRLFEFVELHHISLDLLLVGPPPGWTSSWLERMITHS